MFRTVAITTALIILLLGKYGFADEKEELQGIKKEIREKKLLLKKTKKVESQVTSELGQIEKNLLKSKSNLLVLGQELKKVENVLAGTQLEINTVKLEAEHKKQQIRLRLSSLYKGCDVGAARIYFSSESLPQMFENLLYMRAILNNDRKLFSEYNAKIARLGELKAKLEREAVRKEKIKENIEEKKQEIEDEKKNKAAYLAKVKSDKRTYLASLKELELNARRLQAMVEKLEAKHRKSYTKGNKKTIGGGVELPPVPDTGFGSQKGRLSSPVKGEIIDRFGRHKHPQFNSYTVSNGISIAATSDSDIHSIYEGQVIFSDYFKGYGNLVIVDHGGGYFSLYAHAAKIMKKAGQQVGKNEIVARVGDTDSARGPMLYFEIRYQGKPIDPAAWIR